MPSVDFEIAVERKNSRFAARLSHAEQTGIGKAHGNIGITPAQCDNSLRFVRESEGKLNNALSKKSENSAAVAATRINKVNRLRNGGFTRKQRWLKGIELFYAPGVVGLVGIKISNQGARI